MGNRVVTGLASGVGLTALMALAVGIAAAADPVTLTWDSATGNRNTITPKPVDWGKLLIQTYQKDHPDISISHNYAGGGAYVVQIAGGSGPDVITDCCTTFHDAGVNGAFIDLNPFLGTVLPDFQKTETFWPAQWAAFQSKGHQFALPQYLGTIAVYANAEAFEEAGVALPSPDLTQNHQNWADFEALCKKLTKLDPSGQVLQYGFTKGMGGDRIGYWMQAAGARFYADGDTAKSALASPQAIDALSYLQRLKNQDQCLTGDTGTFSNSKAAMYEDGSWSLSSFIGADAAGKRKVPFEVQVVPLPIGPSGQRATLATIDGIGIAKSTKHLQEALQFLKFLTSNQANTIRAEIIGLQPGRKDVVPQYLNLMDAYNHESFKVNSHVFTDAGAYAYPQYMYADQKIADGILNAAYSKIFDQNMPVQNTWYSAVESLNATLQSVTGPKRPHEVSDVDFGGDAFKSQDVNTITYGTTTVADGVLSMTADGEDIYGGSDGFRYTYESVSGDFTATVKLLQAPTTSEWAKTGIMIRQSIDGDAVNLMLDGTNLHGIRFQHRAEKTGATTDSVDGGAWSNGTPVWLKLVRKGADLTGFRSDDGKTWTQVGTEGTLKFSEPVLIGLAITSHSYAVAGTAKFSDWKLVHSAE